MSPRRSARGGVGPPGGADLLLGHHSVLEALRARRRAIRRLLVRRDHRGDALDEILDAAQAARVPVEKVDPELLRPAGDANPQGVALDAGPLPELELPALCAQLEAPRLLVALDGVEDPQNVGAIARVAEAAGAQGLILTERRAPPLGAALARASAGAIEWLPVARVPNLSKSLKYLKGNGFWTIGADPEAPRSLFEAEDRLLQGDLVIVLGAEGKGLRPSILQEIDHRLGIPMRGRVASLNVATAGAILLFEVSRRGSSPGSS